MIRSQNHVTLDGVGPSQRRVRVRVARRPARIVKVRRDDPAQLRNRRGVTRRQNPLDLRSQLRFGNAAVAIVARLPGTVRIAPPRVFLPETLGIEHQRLIELRDDILNLFRGQDLAKLLDESELDIQAGVLAVKLRKYEIAGQRDGDGLRCHLR